MPQIETTKAVGIVFLPGAMTGLILAAFLVLGSTATATSVVAVGLVGRLFTPDHRLRSLPRPADT